MGTFLVPGDVGKAQSKTKSLINALLYRGVPDRSALLGSSRTGGPTQDSPQTTKGNEWGGDFMHCSLGEQHSHSWFGGRAGDPGTVHTWECETSVLILHSWRSAGRSKL